MVVRPLEAPATARPPTANSALTTLVVARAWKAAVFRVTELAVFEAPSPANAPAEADTPALEVPPNDADAPETKPPPVVSPAPADAPKDAPAPALNPAPALAPNPAPALAPKSAPTPN